MLKKNSNYILFGNDVNHSQSPIIYRLFSEETKFSCHYDTRCVESYNFSKVILDFFNTYGEGANITVPFKEKAYTLSDIVTKRAKISGAVNVLKKTQDNKILGDNTDGIGFLYDLKRLNFIKPKCKILLIGAGGAARGIIPMLLSLKCSIDIVNRTFSRAQEIEYCFNKLGKIHAMEVSSLKELNYDLVINATSITQNSSSEFLISNILIYPAHTFFYDLCYSNDMTCFVSWCKDHGAMYYSDGTGMLVSQAAHSFYLWSGILPKIDPVIDILNANKNYI